MLSSMNATKSLFFLSFLCATSMMLFSSNNALTLIQWEIFSTQSISLTIPIILDIPGLIFSATVLFISANVMWFACSYMSSEPNLKRFIILVLMFVASMNLLIFVPNLVCLLLGWDGLGLVSFILVIYYQNHKSCAAGLITALTNRIGDILLLISISWTLSMDDWSIFFINSSTAHPLIWFTIMVAAMTKSAQVPFSSWLPAAMAAPTPVSALVHSSTLVTAGVFLLFRFYPTLSKFSSFNKSLLLISSITMLMAGLIAMSETDMKKIIALSTLSQLGVMMFSLAINMPHLAFLHLITHALFKACLFICAGNLIHTLHHSQDLRLMGNCSAQMPVTTSCMFIANMALCAMPFMAGFFSKDVIIEMSFSMPQNLLIFIMLSSATFLTVSYSARLTKYVFLAQSNSLPISLTSNTEIFMIKPMITLATGAISSGAALTWNMLPLIMVPALPSSLKMAPISITLLALMFSLSMLLNSTQIKFTPLYQNFTLTMWFLNYSSAQLLILQPQSMAVNSLKLMDQGWTETLGPNGLHKMLSFSSQNTQLFQLNHVNTQILLSLLSISTILTISL